VTIIYKRFALPLSFDFVRRFTRADKRGGHEGLTTALTKVLQKVEFITIYASQGPGAYIRRGGGFITECIFLFKGREVDL